MYHVNGNYGEVRLAHLPIRRNTNLFSTHGLGWHKCNELYQISRPMGSRTHLLFFTVSGRGTMCVDGQEYTLLPGSVAFIPRQTANSYRTPAGGLWEFYWLHPTGAPCDCFLDEIAKSGHLLSRADPLHRYAERMEEILALCSGHAPQNELVLSQKLSDLLHLAAIDLSGKPDGASLSDRAITYIEQNFRKHISLEDIAGPLFISPVHLIRLFKKDVGCTPHQYLIRYRLAAAAQLLKFSDQNVEAIAADVGFSSASLFISNFRRHYNCTPVQYHEKHKTGI